ncbi:MAG: hypothetical protein QW057_03245 [Candidatus Bathyarchaeia archaeon]
MSRRSLLLITVMAIILSILAAPVLAETPMTDTGESRYVIVTLTGKALTRLEGEAYKADASINLQCQVTLRRGNWTVFKVTEGIITVNGTSYAILTDTRGVYNVPRHTAWIKGQAENEAGETARFLLHSVDRGVYHGENDGEDLQGTLMGVRGVFQDPTGRYWIPLISAYMVKVA